MESGNLCHIEISFVLYEWTFVVNRIYQSYTCGEQFHVEWKDSLIRNVYVRYLTEKLERIQLVVF